MELAKKMAIECIKELWHDRVFDKKNTEMSEESKQNVYETLSGVAVQSFEFGYKFAHDEAKLAGTAALMAMTISDEDVEKIKERMKKMGMPEVTDDEEEPQQRTYEPVEPENTDDEEELQIPGVIIVTDEIKKEYPELKNLKMIQKESSGYMTWNDSMQYAKDLDLGGFNDWRLPTMEELRGIYRAKQALGIADDEEWYWSGSEAGASHAWFVTFNDGYVDNHYKSNTLYVRCVR